MGTQHGEAASWRSGVAGYMDQPGACGTDLTLLPAAVHDAGPLGVEAWQAALALLVLLLAAPTVGRAAAGLFGVHPMAGCILLGLLACAPVVDMLPMAAALEHLRPASTACRALVALESALHVAPLRDLWRTHRGSAAAGVVHALCCAVAAFVALRLITAEWVGAPRAASALSVGRAPAPDAVVLPVMVGEYALATAAAIGVVSAAAEPTCMAQLLHDMHSAGVFSATSLHATSGAMLASVLLLLALTPVVSNAHYGISFSLASAAVSAGLTLAVAAALSAVLLGINRTPLRAAIQSRRSLPLVGKAGAQMLGYTRAHASEIARGLKGVVVLAVAFATFCAADTLEQSSGSVRDASSALYSCAVFEGQCTAVPNATHWSEGTVCTLRYQAPGSTPTSTPLSFQPWLACFFASLFVAAGVGGGPGARTRWQLVLQPWSESAHLMLATLSGMWLPTFGVLGAPGAAACAIFVLRAVASGLVSLVAAMAQRQPRSAVAAAPVRGLVQAQVALCFMWELQQRAPALQAFPFDFAAIGGTLVLLELIAGPVLLRLAVRLAGEMNVDRIGRARVLGVEGAPPDVTLKLFEWEVHADLAGQHVAEFEWRVRDVETVPILNDGAIRQMLLSTRVDAFVSMMESDRLNHAACQLVLERHADAVPLCIVRCVDKAWQRKFAVLEPAEGVRVVSDLDTSVRNLLNQFVQSSQSASLLLNDDPAADVMTVTMTEKENGRPVRSLRVPEDVQVLAIYRDPAAPSPIESRRNSPVVVTAEELQAIAAPEPSKRPRNRTSAANGSISEMQDRVAIVPHGHTVLQTDDEVTICGRPSSLATVTALRKGKVVLVQHDGNLRDQ